MGALSRLGISGEAEAARYSAAQEQTKDAFGFKWAKRDTYESLAAQTSFQKWLWERYCDNDPSKLDLWLGKGGKLILDAGCGAGYTAILFFGDHLKTNDAPGWISRRVGSEAAVCGKAAGISSKPALWIYPSPMKAWISSLPKFFYG